MLLFYTTCCNADINASAGLECSKADKSTSDDEFQTNLKKLLNYLTAEAPYRNGFYESREGKDSNKEDFIGDLDRISVAHTKETNLDDPSVSQRGFSMMTELAATTPKQPLMFKTAMLDAGDKGKRYGRAQCNRDISSADCDSCFSWSVDELQNHSWKR
ncbi:hypothetical protein LWI29_021612 [Acer saccharum]|uniref:Gnk2-homologous domain-containing protein n=1 Tax=Acer saccharum TaxID=4024 RepID=A0AA39RUT1_ACESA|nr:hypothetical protein LWI29_021612 [Acer saccharum]